jgi:importin subunit alpha-1
LLSNIAAGNKQQITQLVNTPNLLINVLTQLSEASEWDVRKEAAWVICNIASGGTKAHIQALVENGCLKPICDLLSVGESKMLLLAMEALENILKAGQSGNMNYMHFIDEAEGVDKLELLQEHENQEVYDKAVRIIEK